MTTQRPSSTYSVFPYGPHSTVSSRRKSTRSVRYRLRARNQSTQIQIRRNAQMDFWKLVKPINQANVITRLYHEVLTEIYKEEVAGDSRPGTGKLSMHEQRAIEEAYKQLSPNHFSNEAQRRSPDSQPLYPQRQDSLLPPPPLAERRQAYHDRQRRGKGMMELPLRQWEANTSNETLTPAPLNFSRPDRKGFKERTTPLGSPTIQNFKHNDLGHSVGLLNT